MNNKAMKMRHRLGFLALIGFLALVGVPSTGVVAQEDIDKAGLHAAAETALAQSDQATALSLLTQVTESGQADALTYRLLAEAYVQDGAGISAEAAVLRARDLGADYAITALTLAKSKLLQGAPADALQILNGVPIDPSLRADALIIKADSEFALGNRVAAQSYYTEAQFLEPNNFQPTIGLARVQMQANNLSAARRLALEAEKKAPTKTMVQYTLGLLDRYQGVADGGRGRFEKAVSLRDDNLLARLEIANLDISAGDLEAAEAQLDRVFANTSNSPQANFLAAVVAAQRGQFQDAHALLNKASLSLINYIPGLYVRGAVAYEVGAYTIAVEALGRVLKARPANRRARLTKAAAHLKLEDAPAALRTLEPMILSGKADSETLALAAAAAADIGRLDMAERYLSVAKARNQARSGDDGALVDGFATKLALAQFVTGKQQAAISTMAGSVAANAADLDKLGLLASMQHRAKDYEGAEASAQRIIKADANRALGYNLMGTIRFSQKLYDEAYRYYSSAIERRGDYYTAWKNRGLVALILKRYDDAARDLERVLDREPNDDRAKALLGKVYLETGRPGDAVPLFSEATRTYPRSNDLITDLAIARAQAGETAQAISDARLALKRIGGRPDLLKRLGGMLLDMKQFSLSHGPLSRYLAYYPENTEAIELYGRSLLGAGLYSGAKKIFERADVGLDVGEQQRINWYIFAASVLGGDGEAAIKMSAGLDDAARPGDVSPALLAEAYSAAGRPVEAISTYEGLYGTSPDPALALGLARALRQQGTLDAAVDVLVSEIGRAGGSRQIHEYLGDLRKELADDEGAATAYEAALEKSGADPDIMAKLALTYLKLGRLESTEIAERAYLIRPDDPAMMDMYGWITLQAARDTRSAQDLFEKAISRAPGVALYRYHLAMSFMADRRPIQAKDALQEALHLSEDFEGADSAKALLKQLSPQ